MNTIQFCNAEPVFIDIDDSYNICPNKLERWLEKNTDKNVSGIITVDLFGQCSDYEKIQALAKKYDQIFERVISFPENMQSGYYKYIVFDYDLKEETGKVFSSSDFGNEIEGRIENLPNSYWVADHHHCPPVWYGWEHANKSVEKIADILLR